MKVWIFWNRLVISRFPYWIGFSCRKVGGFGRVFDLGRFKIVWR